MGINEAMASGAAVIASDQCGAAFDLISEKTGVMVSAGNSNELATALGAVLKRSDDMGQAAKIQISNWDFDADITGLKHALDFVR